MIFHVSRVFNDDSSKSSQNVESGPFLGSHFSKSSMISVSSSKTTGENRNGLAKIPIFNLNSGSRREERRKKEEEKRQAVAEKVVTSLQLWNALTGQWGVGRGM